MFGMAVAFLHLGRFQKEDFGGDAQVKTQAKSMKLIFMILYIHPRKFNGIFPLKIGRNPKGKACLPTIIFQGRAVKLRGCMM